jgi:dTDP-4-dehydrorhamnose reductase
MLVTGASGLLGRHLTLASERDGWELIAPSSQALDVRSRDRTIREVRDWKPNVVVHLAYRRDDPRTIVDGTRHVAEAAAAAGARLIHVSTDVVFPGRLAPYSESDLPMPITPYGAWKAEAEQLVASITAHSLVVRPSLMYGTDVMAPIQRDVEHAARRQRRMTFFTDEVRCPAHAADVAAILSAAATTELTGPLHVGGPPVSRADFAAHVARWLGLSAAALHVGSLADSGMIRPGHLVLDTSLAERHGWHCRPLTDALPLRS